MEQTCHRCGSVVSRGDAYCPSCGAAQLHFDASLQESEGVPGSNPLVDARPGQIHWRDAIGAVATVAIPAGLLCALPWLSAGSLIWIMGGTTVVIFLYKRKRPMSLLNGRMGFRIGGLAGLMIAYVAVAAGALLRVVQRYSMHTGDSIDREYEAIVRQSMTVFQTSPDTQAQMKTFLHFMLTPDGRAAWSFMNIATTMFMTIFLAAIGGYLGARMFAGRRLTA